MSRPRLGFLGVGWIGLDRMRAIASSGLAEVVAVADVNPAAAQAAARETGAAAVPAAELIAFTGLDGVVIATPSALHAAQCEEAFAAGLAVFCQKPLARSAAETASVVAAARRSGRPLAVDLSYRHLSATQQMRAIILDGGIGTVFAAALTFHNAYGPDKAWFSDPALAGGGCVIDLGTHLIDLAAWMIPAQRLQVVASQLHANGRLLESVEGVVEDHADVLLAGDAGASILVTCSWRLHAGRDAQIGATFYGTEGAVELRNVGGSFYDFEAFLHRGTSSERIAEPPDQWSGRAAVSWARGLAAGEPTPDAELDELVAVATVIDGIYRR